MAPEHWVQGAQWDGLVETIPALPAMNAIVYFVIQNNRKQREHMLWNNAK